MKPRTLILLMVAVGCGLVAAFLVSQATSKEKVEKIKVPVAKMDLRQGMYIKDPIEDYFEVQEYGRDLLPPNTITDYKDLRNKSLQRTLDKGSLVSKRDLADTEGLAKSLTAGQRAVTMQVTVSSAVSGFVIPGSHVDLICSVPDSKDPRQTMSKIFLQDKLVLAVNTEDVKPDGQKVMNQPGLVTLALTPEEAEKVTRAANNGIPYMILRKPGDDKQVRTPGAISPFGRGNDVETAADIKNVLFSRKAITAGTMIDNVDDYFEVKQVPANLVPGTAVGDRADVNGKKVERFLAGGQMMTKDYLVKDGTAPVETIAQAAKPHIMRIYDGSNMRESPPFFEGRTASPSRGELPPPTTKEGGSEGK